MDVGVHPFRRKITRDLEGRFMREGRVQMWGYQGRVLEQWNGCLDYEDKVV